MLQKIIKTAQKSDKNLTFEIGSNSDLILENTITNNLVWTIENFKDTNKGLLTFPTKFDMVDPILPLDHKGKIIVRMSVNPEEIINRVEFGTSRLKEIIITFRKDIQKHKQLFIIQNTYSNKDVNIDEIFEKGKTTKVTKDSKNHGLGLWEIRQLLKKNHNLNLYTTKTEKYFKQQFEIYC